MSRLQSVMAKTPAARGAMIVGLALLTLACSRHAVPPSPSRVAMAGPSAKGAKVVLGVLPAKATWQWVSPRELVADATTEDDESAKLGAVRSMRLDVEAVLKGERWAVERSDTAAFQATIAILQRTTYREERRLKPTTNLPRPLCDATRSPRPCPPPPAPEYVIIHVPETSSKSVFVIRRRSDGAIASFTSSASDARLSGGAFAKYVITLLKAR